LPKLELLHAKSENLGKGQWRVQMAVANSGYLPSYITKRALERKTARPCMFEIELPAGASLRMGKLRMEGPQLEGHAASNSLQAFLPYKTITGDRALNEWIVEAPVGTVLNLTAHAARAGTVRTAIVLK
jgi:hypothetical protein